MEEYDENIKIVFMGESGMGRSVLIKRYIDKYFDEGMVSTPGGYMQSNILDINGKNIRLEIWDTPGQERYRSLITIFMKNVDIFCIVYDITSKSSFEEIKNYWSYKALEYKKKFTVIAIIGCKSDLYKNQEVDNEEVKEFAESINAIFMLVSSKSQNSVDFLFETLTKKYLESKNNDGYYSINENLEEYDEYSGFKNYSDYKNYSIDNKKRKYLHLYKYLSY